MKKKKSKTSGTLESKSEVNSKELPQKLVLEKRKNLFNMIKLIIGCILALILITIAIVGGIRGNFTFGTFFLLAAAAGLITYIIFHKQIDTFSAHGVGRVLKYTFGVGVALFIGLFAFVSFSGYYHTATGSEPVIIVLGAGLHGEEVGTVLRYRLDAATELWKKDKTATIVVTGGQGNDEVISEALAMQRYLIAQGIPQSSIIMEDKSTSTEENLKYTLTILEQKGYSSDTPIALVTNAFHCYRAKEYAKQAGFQDIRSVPASMSPLYAPSSYSREVFAVLYYWVFRR